MFDIIAKHFPYIEKLQLTESDLEKLILALVEQVKLLKTDKEANDKVATYIIYLDKDYGLDTAYSFWSQVRAIKAGKWTSLFENKAAAKIFTEFYNNKLGG